MLLSKVEAKNNTLQELKLKPFSHFTLGCTLHDETTRVEKALEELADLVQEEVSFEATEVINLGTEQRPTWAVKLNVDPKPHDYRQIFAKLFDPLMCNERNGVHYLWDPDEHASLKCPHVTLGPDKADHETAQLLIGCKLHFNSLDYKRVGSHDPHITKSLLTNKANNKIKCNI